jgi:hypothetical protein
MWSFAWGYYNEMQNYFDKNIWRGRRSDSKKSSAKRSCPHAY